MKRRGAVRREWLVLAGVLGPFAVLVALGLWLTREAPPLTPGAHVVNAPGSSSASAAADVDAGAPGPTARDVRPTLPSTDEGKLPKAADASAPLPIADAGPPEDTPRGLEAALAALRPAVRQCFDDARAHAPPRIELRVRFQAKPDGHFAGYRLEARDWQDPYFEACVEDVFDEVTYAPSGREPPGAVTHTFVLGR